MTISLCGRTSCVPPARGSVNRRAALTMFHPPATATQAQYADEPAPAIEPPTAMIAASLFALAVVFSAKGEIYRCVDADGSIGFHDRPCKHSRSVLIGKKSDSPDADLRKLRDALSRLEQSDPPPRPAARTQNNAPLQLNWRTLGPVDEQRLAVCSSQFFNCAEGNAPRMDRCVAAIPRCDIRRSSGCCPAECVSRYRDLRRNGLLPAPAVRNALLDERYGSCSAR